MRLSINPNTLHDYLLLVGGAEVERTGMVATFTFVFDFSPLVASCQFAVSRRAWKLTDLLRARGLKTTNLPG